MISFINAAIALGLGLVVGGIVLGAGLLIDRARERAENDRGA